MAGGIFRTNFLRLSGSTFSFDMTNHLMVKDGAAVDNTLTAICRKILRYYQEAKQTVKQGAKAVWRGAAKTVPGLGFWFGLGFAVWRLTKGDVVGAGLEVAAGAAACVPGGGTAVAIAIDVGLGIKDVKTAFVQAKAEKDKMEALKAVVEKIERELNDLFTNYEKAKEEYDFVCEVLGDPGYDFEKLDHDIKVVDEVLREFHNN